MTSKFFEAFLSFNKANAHDFFFHDIKLNEFHLSPDMTTNTTWFSWWGTQAARPGRRPSTNPSPTSSTRTAQLFNLSSSTRSPNCTTHCPPTRRKSEQKVKEKWRSESSVNFVHNSQTSVNLNVLISINSETDFFLLISKLSILTLDTRKS